MEQEQDLAKVSEVELKDLFTFPLVLSTESFLLCFTNKEKALIGLFRQNGFVDCGNAPSYALKLLSQSWK
jgi:hypothetical protein